MKRPALGGLLIFLSLRDTPLLTSVLVDAWQEYFLTNVSAISNIFNGKKTMNVICEPGKVFGM